MLDLTGTSHGNLSRPENRHSVNPASRRAARPGSAGDGRRQSEIGNSSAAIPDFWIALSLMIVIAACALYALINP